MDDSVLVTQDSFTLRTEATCQENTWLEKDMCLINDGMIRWSSSTTSLVGADCSPRFCMYVYAMCMYAARLSCRHPVLLQVCLRLVSHRVTCWDYEKVSIISVLFYLSELNWKMNPKGKNAQQVRNIRRLVQQHPPYLARLHTFLRSSCMDTSSYSSR